MGEFERIHAEQLRRVETPCCAPTARTHPSLSADARWNPSATPVGRKYPTCCAQPTPARR
jgi:hypothetical protein